MRQRSDCLPRHEVVEAIDKRQCEFDERTDRLEKDADDVETTRVTMESLDIGGTTEASEAVERAMDAAHSVSVQEFNENGEQLDHTQEQTREYESDFIPGQTRRKQIWAR